MCSNMLCLSRGLPGAFGFRNSLQFPHLDILEPNAQLLAGVDLKSDVPNRGLEGYGLSETGDDWVRSVPYGMHFGMVNVKVVPSGTWLTKST